MVRVYGEAGGFRARSGEKGSSVGGGGGGDAVERRRRGWKWLPVVMVGWFSGEGRGRKAVVSLAVVEGEREGGSRGGERSRRGEDRALGGSRCSRVGRVNAKSRR